ncbi:MAG: hypothetical protein ACR2JF_01540 [Iamia sp.]
MATLKKSGVSMGEALTAAEVDELDYDGLIAARAAVDARYDGPDPGLTKFNAASGGRGWLVARLEVLAEEDPRVVGWVAAAAARRHPGRRQPGDLAAVESALAIAAVRRAMYLTDEGPVGRRGPFCELTVTPSPTTTPDQGANPNPAAQDRMSGTDFGQYGTQDPAPINRKEIP